MADYHHRYVIKRKPGKKYSKRRGKKSPEIMIPRSTLFKIGPMNGKILDVSG